MIIYFIRVMAFKNSRVLYLASNSSHHPENTASSFKVTFNEPFNLAGKEIALISASLTKAQQNVLDETVEIEKKTVRVTIEHDDVVHTNISLLTPRETKPVKDFKEFSKRWNRVVRERNPPKRIIYRVKSEYNDETNGVTLTITNLAYSRPLSISLILNQVFNTCWYIESISKSLVLKSGPRLNQRDAKVKISVFQLLQRGEGTIQMSFNPIAKDEGRFGKDSHMLRSWRTYDLFLRNAAIEISIMNQHAVSRTKTENAVIKPGPGYFQNVEEMIKKLNENELFKENVTVQISNSVASFALKTGVTLKLGGLEHHFGLDTNELTNQSEAINYFIAKRPPDMTRGTHHFFIYCSLVEENAINEQKLAILGTVDATAGKYGEQVSHHAMHPIFVDCRTGVQQQLEINIADETGNRSNLLMGRTLLTCELRNKRT